MLCSTWVNTSFIEVNAQSDMIPLTWGGSSSPLIMQTVALPMEFPWSRI